MRVVLAGGGSAGHIEPALAVADALRQADPGAMIICLGTERGLETRLVPMRGYELAMIPAVPLPRSVTPRLLAVPGKLAGAVSTAAGVLDRMKADVVVGFGGYVATPGYLAARRLARADRGARGQPPPRAGQQAGRPADRARVHRAPRHSAGPRHLPGHPDPAADRRPGPARAGGQGPGPLRAAPGPAGAAGHRRFPGGEVAEQRAVRRHRLAALGRGADPAHHRAAQRGSSCRRRPARRTWRCPTWTGWTWPTPPPTSHCAGPAP